VNFQIYCDHADPKRATGGWWEPYEKAEVTDQASAEAWAKRTIDNFNATLRAGEIARKLLMVKLGGDAPLEHQWIKWSAITKIDPRGGSYDEMRCERCGCRGKRYGLGELGVKRDSIFRSPKWEHCRPDQSDAQAALAKAEQQKERRRR